MDAFELRLRCLEMASRDADPGISLNDLYFIAEQHVDWVLGCESSERRMRDEIVSRMAEERRRGG